MVITPTHLMLIFKENHWFGYPFKIQWVPKRRQKSTKQRQSTLSYIQGAHFLQSWSGLLPQRPPLAPKASFFEIFLKTGTFQRFHFEWFSVTLHTVSCFKYEYSQKMPHTRCPTPQSQYQRASASISQHQLQSSVLKWPVFVGVRRSHPENCSSLWYFVFYLCLSTLGSGGDSFADSWVAVPARCQYLLAARRMHASFVCSMRFVCLG